MRRFARVTILGFVALIVLMYGVIPRADWEKRGAEIFAQEKCLALALYWEGLISEPLDGLRAIAWVVFNRIESKHFPDTICDVVSESTGELYKCQFTFACDGKIDMPQNGIRWLKYLALAFWWKNVSAGGDLTAGSTHYYAHKLVTPDWLKDMGGCYIIGNHTFCRSQRRGSDV